MSIVDTQASLLLSATVGNWELASPVTTGTVSGAFLDEVTPIRTAGESWAPSTCLEYKATSANSGSLIYARNDPANLTMTSDQVVAYLFEFDGGVQDCIPNSRVQVGLTNSGTFGSNAIQANSLMNQVDKRRIAAYALKVDETDDFAVGGTPPDFGQEIDRVDVRFGPSGETFASGFDGGRFLGIYSGWTVGKGYLTLSMDDSHVTQYTDLFAPGNPNRAAELGIPCSCALIAQGTINGASTRMTLPQIRELIDAGWSMSNHGFASIEMTGATEEDMQQDVILGEEWLISEGLVNPNRLTWVYPQGAHGQREVDFLESRDYVLARTTKRGSAGSFQRNEFVGFGYPLVPLEVRAMNLDVTGNWPDAATCLAEIDRAIYRGEWINFNGHIFTDSASGSLEFDNAELELLLAGIKSRMDAGTLEVMTFEDVASRSGFGSDAPPSGVQNVFLNTQIVTK